MDFNEAMYIVLAEECKNDFETWLKAAKAKGGAPNNFNLLARQRVARAQEEQRARGGSYWNEGYSKESFIDYLTQKGYPRDFIQSYVNALDAFKINENDSKYTTKNEMNVKEKQGTDKIKVAEHEQKTLHKLGSYVADGSKLDAQSAKAAKDYVATKVR